jgi:hypothetical protein
MNVIASDLALDWAYDQAFLWWGRGDFDHQVFRLYYLAASARTSGERDRCAEGDLYELMCERLLGCAAE